MLQTCQAALRFLCGASLAEDILFRLVQCSLTLVEGDHVGIHLHGCMLPFVKHSCSSTTDSRAIQASQKFPDQSKAF